MKKIILISCILCSTFLTKAQNVSDPAEGQRQIVINAVIIIVIYLASAFIIKIIKGIQDYRLKSKMIEKGLSDQVVQQFLQPGDKEEKNQTIRAFFILFGIGTGLTLISYVKPDIIMAIALLSFTIAAGILAYYIYLKKVTQ